MTATYRDETTTRAKAQEGETMKTTTTTTTAAHQAEQLALATRARQPYAGLEIRAQLAMVREATSTKANTPADIVAVCEDLRQLAQEAFNVITVDAKNRIIARHLVSLGILNAALVHPREVFRPALLDGAACIICVHNHPSGDPSPSAEDLKITRQLVEAGRIVDVKLLDHVIIGRPGPASADGYLSLRESGLVSFA